MTQVTEGYDANTVLCPEYRTWFLKRHRPCAHWNQRCPHWVKITNKDPDTGNDVSRWGCGLAWKTVNDINLQRQVAGLHRAINDLRNHTVPALVEARAVAVANLEATRAAAEATKSLVERVEERRTALPPPDNRRAQQALPGA